jgi:ribosomal protein L7/L12
MAKDILPPTVVEALEAGNKIEAIKRLRAITGQGLKESKDWIDSYERSHAEPTSEPQFGRPEGRDPQAAFRPPPEAIEALKRGNLVEAVKILRRAGVGLAEAKAILDQIQKATPAGARFFAHKPATHLHVPTPGLGPGEVPRGSGPGKWFALIMIGLVAVLAALYFRR